MRRSRAVIAVGAAAAVLVAGGATAAFATRGDDVSLAVDGHHRALHTTAHTVGAALHAAGVSYTSRDLVVPAANSSLRNGLTITVKHARELDLTVDGQPRTVWVLADSVGTAMDQLGLSGTGVVLSASRSARIPLQGLALSMRLPHVVTVVADGHRRQVTTTAASVADLLVQLHLKLARTDKVSKPLSWLPADGATITVTRIRYRTVAKRTAVGYPTVRRADSALYKGTDRTVTTGRNGRRVRTYRLTLVNGHVTHRHLLHNTVTIKPRTEVVHYGTRSRPVVVHTTTSSSSGGSSSGSSSSGGSGSYSSGGSYGSLDWAALARCESGGNPRAVNPTGTYRGLYQFSLATWHAVGGSGDPIDASPSEQTYRAWILYQRAGAGSWPVCGRYL